MKNAQKQNKTKIKQMWLDCSVAETKRNGDNMNSVRFETKRQE
jgi:hypothetical protein